MWGEDARGAVQKVHMCPGGVTKGVTTAQYLGPFIPRGSTAPVEVRQ